MNLPGRLVSPIILGYISLCGELISFYQIKKATRFITIERERKKKTECTVWAEVLEGGIEFRQS